MTACYARNPSTDGHRIVYHVAGDIWMLDGPGRVLAAET